MRCLLDKVTARYIVQGLLKLAENRELARKEDAAVLALGTFGTNEAKIMLGVNVIATFDQPMINQWFLKQSSILERLEAIQDNVPAPYNQAKLPQVLRPEQISV